MTKNVAADQCWKNRIFGVILVAFALLCVEGVVRVAARTGAVRIRTYPVRNGVTRITFVGNLNPHFGVWHVPNALVRWPTPLGEVIYKTNGDGMRDRPRERKSAAHERVVVLGDSFVEGCFVAASNRVTDLLEQRTGVEFLNFGTSGGFGSVQEWLLYQNLAHSFDHTRVILFLLPDNDFDDNNPNKHSANRYQPFLQKSNGTYSVAYTSTFSPGDFQTVRLSWGRALRHAFYNRYYTLNVLMNLDFEKSRVLNRSAYDEYSEEDLAQLLFSYEQLLAAAKPRPLTIFIIPRDSDFMAVKNDRFQGRLTNALATWAARQERVTVVDLLPGFLDYMKEYKVPYQDFFLSFDPHWSPMGHRVAAGLVQAELEKVD